MRSLIQCTVLNGWLRGSAERGENVGGGFERLAKPSFDEAPDDEGYGQRGEGKMDGVSPLVADGAATVCRLMASLS